MCSWCNVIYCPPPPHYPQTPHTLPPSPNIWKCYTTYKQRMFPINRCSQKTSTLLLFYKLMVKIRVTKEECVFFYLRVYMLVGLCGTWPNEKRYRLGILYTHSSRLYLKMLFFVFFENVTPQNKIQALTNWNSWNSQRGDVKIHVTREECVFFHLRVYTLLGLSGTSWPNEKRYRPGINQSTWRGRNVFSFIQT